MEVKSFKMWGVVNCTNVSEKASKERTRKGSFNWPKRGPLSPWKGSPRGLLQVEFRLQCEKKCAGRDRHGCKGNKESEGHGVM